jgi:excinuclease ABC subunit B
VSDFQLVSPYQPAGDQPAAIAELTAGLKRGDPKQVLLGATGTGKTFAIAHVIANQGLPTLVMSHNKTLAAQLYGELKALFPHNAVEYFISYYDYYQPEAYVASTDTYIEKDASINEDIERLRLRATSSLMERKDVIVVASVSCIFGLGNPADYRGLMLHIDVGGEHPRKQILQGLVNIHYKRNDYLFERGTFRVRGDTVEVYPAYDEQAIRIELWGDEVERISRFDPLTGEVIAALDRTAIYPASHYVTRKHGAGDTRRTQRPAHRIQDQRAVARSAETRTANPFRHRDDAGNRDLPWHRELFALYERSRHG